MKTLLGFIISSVLFSGSILAAPQVAPQEPEIVVSNGKVSINVERITLERLLRIWDQATGMKSTVPKDLANRSVSLRFSGVNIDDAVRRMFEKQSIDYIFMSGKSIVVTGVSQSVATPAPGQANMAEPVVIAQPLSEPSQKAEPMVMGDSRQKPTVVPTPFGIIENPRGRVVQLPPIPGETLPPPFFPEYRAPVPPAGAPNGPLYNSLFGPISIRP